MAQWCCLKPLGWHSSEKDVKSQPSLLLKEPSGRVRVGILKLNLPFKRSFSLSISAEGGLFLLASLPAFLNYETGQGSQRTRTRYSLIKKYFEEILIPVFLFYWTQFWTIENNAMNPLTGRIQRTYWSSRITFGRFIQEEKTFVSAHSAFSLQSDFSFYSVSVSFSIVTCSRYIIC